MSNKTKKLVVYNSGKNIIFISLNPIADPKGGPGIAETTYSLFPGQGVDLSILGVTTEKPNEG